MKKNKKIKMYNEILNNYENKVEVNGVIAKKFFDTDINNNKFSKIIIENEKVIKDKKYITSIKCYLYNSLYNLVKNNGYKYGDYVKIIGELQNRNDNLVIFVNQIKLINKKECCDENY